MVFRIDNGGHDRVHFRNGLLWRVGDNLLAHWALKHLLLSDGLLMDDQILVNLLVMRVVDGLMFKGVLGRLLARRVLDELLIQSVEVVIVVLGDGILGRVLLLMVTKLLKQRALRHVRSLYGLRIVVALDKLVSHEKNYSHTLLNLQTHTTSYITLTLTARARPCQPKIHFDSRM